MGQRMPGQGYSFRDLLQPLPMQQKAREEGAAKALIDTIPGLNNGDFSGTIDPKTDNRRKDLSSQINDTSRGRATKAIDRNEWNKAYNNMIATQPPTYKRAKKDLGYGRDFIKMLAANEQERLPYSDIDLSPMIALVDNWTGSNLLKGYNGPPADKTFKRLSRAAQLVQNQEQMLTNTEMQMLRQQLRDYWENQFGMRTQAGIQQSKGGAHDSDPLRQALMWERLKNERDKPSPYAEKYQEAVARSSAEFKTKNLQQLQQNAMKVDEAISLLSGVEKGDATGWWQTDNISGEGVKLLGSEGQNIFAPNAARVRDLMQGAIVETLRPTLGAQFTQKEGEQIKALTFNPSLSERENLRRAKKLRQYFQRKIDMGNALHDHMLRNGGTDEGFDYSKYGMIRRGSEPATNWMGQQPTPIKPADPNVPAKTGGIDDAISKAEAALKRKREQKGK